MYCYSLLCLLCLYAIISGRYFDEISQDTGKYCFGVEDTLKALEMGSVEILIAWENLDIVRYVLKNHTTDGKWNIFYKNKCLHFWKILQNIDYSFWSSNDV